MHQFFKLLLLLLCDIFLLVVITITFCFKLVEYNINVV
jgi:hypothetical protein